mgnify:CR=1 FL=1
MLGERRCLGATTALVCVDLHYRARLSHEHLNRDGEYAADQRYPPRNTRRQVEGEENTGNHRTPVTDGDRPACHTADYRFGRHTRGNRKTDKPTRPDTKEINGSYYGGKNRCLL